MAAPIFRWPPTLDASSVFSANKLISTPHARRSFAAELVSHLRDCGFARISNHGVPTSTIKRLFKCHSDFFNLSLSSKLSVRHPGGESPARGYSPWAYEKTAVLRPDLHTATSLGSTTSTAQSLNPSPSLRCSVAIDPTRPLSGTLLDAREQFAIGPPSDAEFPTPQLAEQLLPGFNAITRAAYLEIQSTCRRLVDIIEEGLNVPPNAISNPTAGGEGAELNLNFYPEVERNVLDDGADTQTSDKTRLEDSNDVTMRRIWPHSDLGVVSALFQDGIGASGLELQVRESPESEFAPLSIEQEGDIVLLVSDTLERWTNGYLRAAVHRVGLPPASSTSGMARVPDRRSAVMFFRAPPTADVGPLPYFVSAENPARYEHVTAGEYLKRHNRRLY
ncbi:Clavaminate synthase-like protein [Hypomontagnella monticulosa]|nr:Clavaminate synthase-like protein [Hypomontagnella monticulosa]